MKKDDEETDWAIRMRRRAEAQATALNDLAENRERRERAEAEVEEARKDLAGILARGQDAALEVAEMARVSGISRDTAHRRLREVGSISRRERFRREQFQRWQERRGSEPSLEELEGTISRNLGKPPQDGTGSA